VTMSYITLRGLWCDIIVLNVHASTEDESDGMKDICTRNQSVTIPEVPHKNVVRRRQCKSRE